MGRRWAPPQRPSLAKAGWKAHFWAVALILETIPSMVTHTVTLRNKLGLHARPASHFVKIAGRYKETKVELVREGEAINGKSILGVMMLAAGHGSMLEIRCDGPDEQSCLDELIELVNNKFYEE